MSTHNLCLEQKYEKYQNFLSEIFHFSVVKFSVYLNRLVFVIKWFKFFHNGKISSDCMDVSFTVYTCPKDTFPNGTVQMIMLLNIKLIAKMT